jgi:hypothetical protein
MADKQNEHEKKRLSKIELSRLKIANRSCVEKLFLHPED